MDIFLNGRPTYFQLDSSQSFVQAISFESAWAPGDCCSPREISVQDCFMLEDEVMTQTQFYC